MRIRLQNLAPYTRTAMHTTTLPLADGVLRPDSPEDALIVHDATGSGSVDWVQWWPYVSPRARAAGSQGELYPSGYMRKAVVCFPAKIDAGVHVNSRTGTTPTAYEYYTDKWVDIEYAPGTVSPSFWSPDPDTFGSLSTPGAVRFELADGTGRTNVLNASLAFADEQFPSWASQGDTPQQPSIKRLNANVRIFRKTQRMTVPDPSVDVALWHEVMIEVQRAFDGNGRAVRWWYNWGVSDNRIAQHVHLLQNRITMTVSIHADPTVWHEDVRLPEYTPTVYSAAGSSVVTPGSGSSRNITFGGAQGHNQFTEFALWDPSDRLEVNGIESHYRDRMTEGNAQLLKGSLAFRLHEAASSNPEPTQQDLDSMAAAAHSELQGIAEDFQNGRAGEQAYGNHGYVPPYNVRQAFASVDAAHAAACDQADEEYQYHRTQGQSVTWPVRDPLQRAIMGTRPSQGAGGDSPGFGHVKAWHLPATTCGDLRALEATTQQMFANFALSLREPDGSIMDPTQHADATTREVLLEQAVPFYQGLPGLGASSLFPNTTVNGKAVQPDPWGIKPNPQFDDTDGGRGIQLGAGGDRSNRWGPDEQLEGGFDQTHQDLNAVAAYALLSADPMIRYLLDGVALQPLCGQLTPKTDEGFKYYADAWYHDLYARALPESSISSAPFCTFVRGHARQLQSALYCYRLTGDTRLRDHATKHLLRSIRPFAVGSSHRGIRWFEPSRYPGPGGSDSWNYRHEFHPATDVGSCWAWCAIPETQQETTQLIAFGGSAGGDRRWISYLKNREGTSSRDFVGGSYPSAHPPVFWGDYPFDLSTVQLDTASTFSHEYLKPIGADRVPDGTANGTQTFGTVLSQSESLGATSGFTLFGAFVFTRTSGNGRILWGSTLDDNVDLDATTGDLYITIAGGARTKIASAAITPGVPVVLEIFRSTSDVISVLVNGDDSSSLDVTYSGTFDVSGFGWDGDGTDYFDDCVLEFGYFSVHLGVDNRRKVREYLRSKWDLYSTPEFSLTESSGHWENVPMTYAEYAGLGRDAVMLQPGNSLFQMSMLCVVMHAFRELFKAEASQQPTGELSEAVAFAEEWVRKASRWISYHGMSSNGGFTRNGVSGVNHTAYKVAAFDRLLTSDEMVWNGVSDSDTYPYAGQSQDSSQPGPNNFRWYAADTWMLAAQYMPAMYLATKYLTDEPATVAQAIGMLERNLPAVLADADLGGLPTFGFGDPGYSDAQSDPWLWISEGIEGPYDPTQIRVSMTLRGTNTLTLNPRLIKSVEFAHAGTNALAAVPTIVPIQTTINATFTHSGSNTLGLTVSKTTKLPAFTLSGTNTLSTTPRQTFRALFDHSGVGTLNAQASVQGATVHRVRFEHDGVGSLGVAAKRNAKVSFAHSGVGALGATCRLLRPHSATFAHAGVNAISAVAQVLTPRTVFERFSHEGRNILRATPKTAGQIFCTFSHTGQNVFMRLAATLGLLPEPGEFVSFVQAAFKAMVDRRGRLVTFYSDGGQGDPKQFKVLLDEKGTFFDGDAMHAVEGVIAHVPKASLGTKTIKPNDLFDVPMQSGRSTRRARVISVVHQDEAKFVVEVEN